MILPGGPVRTNGTRVTFSTVLSYGTSGVHTPRSGINSRASLKRLLKFAMQIARVSSTSFSNVLCNSGEACSFVSGFTTPILGLLFLLPIFERGVSAQIYQGAEESETGSRAQAL